VSKFYGMERVMVWFFSDAGMNMIRIFVPAEAAPLHMGENRNGIRDLRSRHPYYTIISTM